MSVILGSATVPASSTVKVFTLPSGLANFTVYQPSQPQAVYLGTSSGVAATTGMPVPNTPLNQELYVASTGITYWATTGNATASSFSFVVCTAT